MTVENCNILYAHCFHHLFHSQSCKKKKKSKVGNFAPHKWRKYEVFNPSYTEFFSQEKCCLQCYRCFLSKHSMAGKNRNICQRSQLLSQFPLNYMIFSWICILIIMKVFFHYYKCKVTLSWWCHPVPSRWGPHHPSVQHNSGQFHPLYNSKLYIIDWFTLISNPRKVYTNEI